MSFHDGQSIQVTRFNAFRPSDEFPAIAANGARFDDVLIAPESDTSVPWARMHAVYQIQHNNKVHTFACVRVFELVDDHWIDPQTYTPHLRVTNQLQYLDAAKLKQRVLTCRDTRVYNEECIWIAWFLVWGPLKYPCQHRDEMFRKYEPRNSRIF
jgi:hypothetical protein